MCLVFVDVSNTPPPKRFEVQEVRMPSKGKKQTQCATTVDLAFSIIASMGITPRTLAYASGLGGIDRSGTRDYKITPMIVFAGRGRQTRTLLFIS